MLSYVERNQAMIDHCDFCIFYFDENYQPEIEKFSKNSAKSGTKLAFEYAKRRKKIIYNIF